MNDKIIELVNNYNGSILIHFQPHKFFYKSVMDYMNNKFMSGDIDEDGFSVEVLKKMEETDTIIYLQICSCDPMEFHNIYHYDLEVAIDEAIKILRSLTETKEK